MKTKLLTLLSISAISLGLNACMMHEENEETHRPDNYKKVSVYEDSRGTTTVNQSTRKTDEDKYGNRKTVTKTKTTKDPKGMFNKTTTTKTKTSERQY